MDESKENVPTRTTRASARGRQDTATVALTKVIGGTNRHNGGSSQGDDATVGVDGAPTEALTSGGDERFKVDARAFGRGEKGERKV